MGITNLGAVSMSAGGVYNPETVYKKYKVVSANGGSYMYINPTPAAGVSVTDTAHWQQIAEKGETGDVTPEAEAARDAAQGYKDDAAAYAAQLAAGTASPAGTYENLAALIEANPDHAKIYITLDDGKWCYYNGSAWVAGGVYQAASTALEMSRMYDVINDVMDVSIFEKNTGGGQVYPYTVEIGVEYLITNLNNDNMVGVRTCTSDGTAVEAIKFGMVYNETVSFVADKPADYIRFYSENPGSISQSFRVTKNGNKIAGIDESISGLDWSVKSIKNRISPIYLGMSKYEIPIEFGMSSPFGIYTDGSNFVTDFDADDHKNVGGETWFVAPNYTLGSGKTRYEPVQFNTAYNSAASGDTIILLEGTYTRNTGGYLFSSAIKKSLNIIAEGDGALMIDGNFITYSKTNEYTNVYNGTRSHTKRIIDASLPGKYIPYVAVESVSAVDNTPGSYYIDGTTVYVHDLTSGDPTGHVVCCINYEKTLDISNADENVKVYVENITLVGKYTGILINKENTSNSMDVCFNNVTSILCGNEETSCDAFKVYGGNVIFNKCKALSSYKDGFNYSGVNKAAAPCDCHCAEIECVGGGCGHEAAGETMNASTGHLGAKIIRVNGKYYDCNGASVADVQTGTQSVNLGCIAYSPYCASSSSQNFSAQQAGAEMWLDGCLAVGGLYDVFCFSDATIHSKNSAYKTKSIYETGTFDEARSRELAEAILLRGGLFSGIVE